MIIQINATVCAAEDDDGDGRHRIVGSDQPRRCVETLERASNREKEEIEGARQK